MDASQKTCIFLSFFWYKVLPTLTLKQSLISEQQPEEILPE